MGIQLGNIIFRIHSHGIRYVLVNVLEGDFGVMDVSTCLGQGALGNTLQDTLAARSITTCAIGSIKGLNSHEISI